MTAADARQVAIELREAGVREEDIESATIGAMQLATHGALSYADAARITALAITTFGL